MIEIDSCVKHGLLGGMPPPRKFFEKMTVRRLNLVGFWQLADYPTLCVQN